jgi:superfamily I DNA/RNA helicase
MRTVQQFCQSADPDIDADQVPRQEGLDRAGNEQLAQHLAGPAWTAWADLCSHDGILPFRHEHYLKLWQLAQPRLDVDFVLFDEAQDANPVMAAVVAAQAGHAQLGWIGDSQQQIYGFTGAINALDQIDATHTAYLTRSWRFGPTIAAAANQVLAVLDTPLRLVGNGPHHGRVGHVLDDDVQAVLTRTNARAMVEVLAAVEDDRRPHLLGGGKEIIDFARGAADLMDGRKSMHPDLACFDTWSEVLDYVEDDELGTELALLAALCQRFGPTRLISTLRPLPKTEDDADLVISTAHKAKGREWSHVRLTDDLDVDRDDEAGLPLEELRLLYVAVTRAREELDPTNVQLDWPWLHEETTP